MRNLITHRLKQLHAEMKALWDKTANGAKLTQSEQAELGQLAAERDEVIISLFLPAYYSSPIIPHQPDLGL
jgi:hypothetical protein